MAVKGDEVKAAQPAIHGAARGPYTSCMKRISLFRHAEAIDGPPGMADIDRPLTARGRQDAAAIGAVIARRAPLPDAVLCSPSIRTRETLDCAHLPGERETIFNPAIYLAPAKQILAAIKALPDSRTHILVIGHNPGFHDLALKLAEPTTSDANALKRVTKKFPKGALASFEFDAPVWRDIERNAGRLTGFTRPKDLRRR
ncbi:SixA phosphatase family protein [Hyphococcus sp.]|uniref:SixA phosphatase family protein n=1 Tax=Hyphococcus sp. TaxID=2038636 RepID=UPI0035C68FC6